MVMVGGMMKTLRLLVTGSVLVLTVACASGKPSEPVQSGSAVPTAGAGNGATLDSLRAEALPSPRLVLETTGSPAYTSYNPQPDVFVLDLPRTTKIYGLAVPTNLPSYVASVAADEAIEMGRPLTRVTVRFTTPMSATATTVDGDVIINFSEPSMAAAGLDAPPEIEPIASPAAELPEVAEVETEQIEQASTPQPVEQNLPPAKRLRAVRTLPGAVVLETDGAVEFKTFRLANPLRLVVDLKGVVNHVREKRFDVAASNVRQVRVSQFQVDPEAITRIVVDLDELVEYDVSRDGRNLRISFGRSSSVPPAALAQTSRKESVQARAEPPVNPEPVYVAPPPAPEPEAEPVPEMTPVVQQASTIETPAPAPAQTRIERQEPAAPVAATRTEESAEVTVAATAQEHDIFEEEAPEVAMVMPPPPPAPVRSEEEFRPVTTHRVNSPAPQAGPRSTATATLPESTARVTPVEDVFVEPPITRVGPAIDLSGAIEPGTSRTLSTEERVYTGEPLSLTLKDADIKDVLRTFAQLTGLNIAIDPQVTGTVSVEFTDVPWDQALELILRQNGLAYDLEGNVMRIGTVDRLATEQAATRRREEEKRLNVPTTSVARRLSYAKAGEISTLLSQLASPRGKIIVDERTNQIIITDIPEALRLMLNMVDTVDIPTPQVIIEARIVETTKTFSRQFGFSLGFNADFDPALGTGTGLQWPNRILTGVGGPGSVFDLAIGRTVFDISLTNVLGTFDLDLLLAAAENEGLARVISAPRIATQDNAAAEIQSGIQIPFQTRVNFTTTVAFVDATLRLSVTPQITAENTVIMIIEVQKVEPAEGLGVTGGENVPLITRRAQTRLMVRDGGTAVIGGIYQSTDNDAENRVPILHEVPVLGNLFKNRNTTRRHDELLIFITPRIVRGT